MTEVFRLVKNKGSFFWRLLLQIREKMFELLGDNSYISYTTIYNRYLHKVKSKLIIKIPIKVSAENVNYAFEIIRLISDEYDLYMEIIKNGGFYLISLENGY